MKMNKVVTTVLNTLQKCARTFAQGITHTHFIYHDEHHFMSTGWMLHCVPNQNLPIGYSFDHEQLEQFYILDLQRKCYRQLANFDVGHRVEMEKCKPAIHGSCTLLWRLTQGLGKWVQKTLTLIFCVCDD